MKVLKTKDTSFKAEFAAIRSRAGDTAAEIDATVRDIIGQVRSEGDAALLRLTEKFDGHRDIIVPPDAVARRRQPGSTRNCLPRSSLPAGASRSFTAGSCRIHGSPQAPTAKYSGRSCGPLSAWACMCPAARRCILHRCL